MGESKASAATPDSTIFACASEKTVAKEASDAEERAAVLAVARTCFWGKGKNIYIYKSTGVGTFTDLQ